MEKAEAYLRIIIREALKKKKPLVGGFDIKINEKLGNNLKIVDNKVISYASHVADIEPVTKFLFVKPEYVNFSQTTNRHLRNVVEYYGLQFFGGRDIFKGSKLSRRSRFL
jgi:hypothetical protein